MDYQVRGGRRVSLPPCRRDEFHEALILGKWASRSLALRKSEDPHRIQHRLDARDFVRAKQIRFTQRRQHREERLGAAYFVAEILERVR